ncbi:MAG: hypothetical protein GX556_16540 [Fibrobacter sp.]|nr:hypothetical protein [Fibrobacter sp.]
MKYIYRGPVSGVTLKTSRGKLEKKLFPGREVDLPPEHPHVRVMEARGHLVQVYEGTIARGYEGTRDEGRVENESRQEAGSGRVKKEKSKGGTD